MNDPNTFWLNLTNIALGLATLFCLFMIGRWVVREVAELVRARSRVRARRSAHELVLSDLGVTMADGGVEIDESEFRRLRQGDDDPSDPPNIVRSNN